MNEEETRAELIDPALKDAGWGVADGSRVRREFPITLGRLQGFGRRKPPERADYMLMHRNKMLAIIEAKARDKSDTEGVGQAKDYAEKLHIRYAYSTNGVGIYQMDMQTGDERRIQHYPSPQDLWDMTYAEHNQWRDLFAQVPFEDKGGQWQPRYYQDIAINKALEAIAHGRQRILLTLATGTGKTAIAFQIAWKLFKSRWTLARDGKRQPRILFLADRKILAEQASGEFSAFPEDALAKINPREIRRRGRVPKNASVFFTIFQTFMTGHDEDGNPAPYFGEYPPDFFDFIVIDECHRGGAKEESSWRGIMEYFAPAVQLGLTATPKRTDNADTYAYFGEPVYIYSLNEGINDGFLTPFKVRQFATTLDDYIYTPDDDVIEGKIEERKRYGEKDFNRIIEIKEREAYRVKLFMDNIDQAEKTIVFCATQIHARAVRDLINQMKKSSEPNYCVRVTADDGKIGDQHLKTFQDNERTIPTILTTSQKLSTGVDARNIRNIVLMRPINSMIEFKQIIGRGTRLFDDKDYFTIHDFVKAYEHFSDPEWDGEPVELVPASESDEPEKIKQDDPEPQEGNDDEAKPPRQKIKIKLADGKERTIQHMMTTTFWDPSGKPVSSTQAIERLFGVLPDLFKNEDELRKLWSKPETRNALLKQLAELGFGDEQLTEIMHMIDAVNSDLYDVLAYIAYKIPPMSRQERVDGHRDDILNQYDNKLQTFLDYVLAQYVKEGVRELDQGKLENLVKVKYITLRDAETELGNMPQIRDAFVGFQQHLYS